MVERNFKNKEATVVTRENPNRRGWICISKTHESIVRAGDGYSESLGLSYEWRTVLPNGAAMAKDDFIVIRDHERILGVSIIESIKKGIKPYISNHCPSCNRAQVRERKTVDPKYKCAHCKKVFTKVRTVSEKEEFQTAKYAPGWVQLDDSALTRQGWKRLSVTPKSQHSIQRLDVDKFDLFRNNFDTGIFAPFDCRNPGLHGGHRLGTVRTRIGQADFRQKLLKSFGNVCAFTGINHENAIEAAHLYSYSELGVHHQDGGLLLRRDVHRLFDTGLIAINPNTECIDLAPELRKINAYNELIGRRLQIDLNQGLRKWIALHWKQHRK